MNDTVVREGGMMVLGVVTVKFFFFTNVKKSAVMPFDFLFLTSESDLCSLRLSAS